MVFLPFIGIVLQWSFYLLLGLSYNGLFTFYWVFLVLGFLPFLVNCIILVFFPFLEIKNNKFLFPINTKSG